MSVGGCIDECKKVRIRKTEWVGWGRGGGGLRGRGGVEVDWLEEKKY